MFIGSDRDARTIQYGLKTGQSYGVTLRRGCWLVRMLYGAQLVANVNGHNIPYQSINAFTNNWKVIAGEKIIHN